MTTEKSCYQLVLFYLIKSLFPDYRRFFLVINAAPSEVIMNNTVAVGADEPVFGVDVTFPGFDVVTCADVTGWLVVV